MVGALDREDLKMVVSKSEQPEVIAYLEDEQDVNVVREVLKNLGIKNSEVNKGGIKEAIKDFSHKRSPKHLIIDISKSDLVISDLNRLSDTCEPGESVIAVGVKNDVGLYRDLMKFGVFEYVVSPLFPEIIGRVVKSVVFDEEKGKDKSATKLGKIIAFVGARGGVGSSFIATNFATMLSSEKKRRVVVLDLDLHYGTVSLYLDIKVKYGLKDALENPDNIDRVFVERILNNINEHLCILSSEEPLGEQLRYKIDGIQTLLNHLSKLFHYIIVDIPHYSDIITKNIIGNAQMMILVTDPSIAGLRDSGKLISLFGEEGTARRIVLVMNKVGGFKKGELTPAEFEQALNHKVNHVIPYDSLIPMEYVNQGKTLVGEDNSLALSIRELVNDMLGIRKPEEKPGGLINFFKSFKLK